MYNQYTQKSTHMKTKEYTPVGVFDEEIFIYSGDDYKGKMCFDVIRPVSKGMLEEFRSVEHWMEEERDLWVEAVKAGDTNESLQDWMDDFVKEELAEGGGDKEYFPLKDDSFTEYLDYNTRTIVDKYIKETQGYEVGTWETSGCFSPYIYVNGKSIKQKFDLVLDEELANRYYNENNLI